MLIITRKADQEIHIGEDIVIKVIKTGRGSVKIGVDAPSQVRILRAELPPLEDMHILPEEVTEHSIAS